MPAAPPPFALRYSPQLPELLDRLACSLALTTYQAGKVILVSAVDGGERLVQLPRSFDKPMGLGYDAARGRLALACRDRVVTFANSPQLAAHHPASPATYDALFAPRLTYHTGPVDVHDLRFGLRQNPRDETRDEGALYAVNTRFDAIVTLDDEHNFRPWWRPPHLGRLAADDRCHVNGMAMRNGRPRYATAFGTGDAPRAWRDTLPSSGVIYELDSGQVVATGLGMPHSPRLHGGGLYVLTSADGLLRRVDVAAGRTDVVADAGGFARGLDFVGDYAFVALSKLRRNSSTFAKLPRASRADRCGMVVVHLPTGARVAELAYETSVDEIYDVLALPGLRRPNILSTDNPTYLRALSTPRTTFWAQKSATPSSEETRSGGVG